MERLGFVLALAAAAALIRPSRGAMQHPCSLVLDGDLVEKIWLTCLQGIAGAEEMLSNVGQSSGSDELSSRSSENDLKTMLFLELMAILPYEKKLTVLDCIHGNHINLGVPQEFSAVQSAYLEYQWPLPGRNFSPRRHLADRPVADAPSVAPAFAPSRSSGDEATVPLSVSETSVTAPSNLHRHGAPPVPKPRGVPRPMSPSEKHSGYMKAVLIAVLATAALTSAAALAVFRCCWCSKSKVSVGEQRDEHPLLRLRSADMACSSPNVNAIASSVQKSNQGGDRPSKAGLNMAMCVSCFCGASNNTRTPAQVTEGIQENNAPSDAPKPKPPPPLPPPPPPPPIKKAAFRPSAPPKGVAARIAQASLSSDPNHPEESSAGEHHIEKSEAEVSAPRAKLRPFYWDKVLAHPDQSMAWDHIKFGSFQVNEEMIEELFGYGARDKKDAKDMAVHIVDPSSQHVCLLDVKKSCNLAVVFKAMNVKMEDIQDALIEGNELPRLLLETILRMTPTDDEELKLRLYGGDCSQLGLAEQVMKALLDIPFAFKRINAMLLMSSLQEDASSLRESFLQLEVACEELRNRLFLKLLEAVLKTGNRLNDGTFHGGAHAFKLDTLLKLSDVKGADGKTTLLHFVVQEIIRSEGVREAKLAMESGRMPPLTTADYHPNGSLQENNDYYSSLGLKIVSRLSSELENIRKAAALDADALSDTLKKLSCELLRTKEFLNSDMATVGEDTGFYRSLRRFTEHADSEMNLLLKEEKRVGSLVKRTIRYFHGNNTKDDGFRLFVVVRDFLVMLDKACKEVQGLQNRKKVTKRVKIDDNRTPVSCSSSNEQQSPAILDHQLDSSDSND